MRPELLAQNTLGSHRAGKDNETACILVKALNNPQARQRAFAFSAFADGNQLGYDVLQSRGKILTPLIPGALAGMANRGYSRRLFDNDEMVIQIADDHRFLSVKLLRRSRKQFD